MGVIRPPAPGKPVPATGNIATRWETLPDVTPAIDGRPTPRLAADPVAAARCWGRLPEAAVAAGGGLVAVALGARLAREGSGAAAGVFWVGMLAILVPVALRIAFARIGRPEGIGLSLLLGLGVYLARIMRGPGGFLGFDELIHYRTASDIVDSGHLYAANPMLPVSPVFPGLEIVTSAISKTTGLGVVTSGLIVVGVARVLLVVSLFLLLHELLRSVRLAATGTVLYAGSSTFFAFNTQYAYESLGIGFACVLLYLAARLTRTRRAQPAPRPLALVAVAIALALVFTHHLTAYATAGILVLWAAVHLTLRRRLPRDRSPLLIGLLVVLATAVWSVVVASDVFSYLGGPIADAVDGIRGLLHDGGSRRPFESAAGKRTTGLEQLVGTAGTVAVVLALPLGLLAARRHAPRRALAIVLVLLGLAYPASLVLRVADGGWEASNRASSFLYLGVALLATLAVWRWRPPAIVPRPPHLRKAVAAVLLVVVPVTGIVIGSSENRLPRPYAVGDGSRSIDAHGIEASRWMRRELGPGNRVASDRTTTSLMNAYGLQDVVTSLRDGVSVSPLFLSTVIGTYERALLRQGAIGYLAVDRRIEGATTPPDGDFYEPWELTLYPDAYSQTTGLDPARLRKWDGQPGAGRVFDDGSIVVYDVRAVRDAP